MSDGGSPEILCIVNGQFAENCYLVADTTAGECAVVDPGEESGRILAEIARRGWRVTGVWLTHAHVDHVAGVGAVRAATGAAIHLHPDDRPLYDSLPQQAVWLGVRVEPAPAPDVELAHGQRLRVGAHEFEVRHTPGHSPGGVSLIGAGRAIVGDALFAGSIGRTDLPGGNAAQLLRSIREQLLSLPDETVVFSGHGPATTIGAERATNPFLTGAYELA